MFDAVPCGYCGQDVRWFEVLSGRRRAFWAEPWPIEQVAPKDQYGLRRRQGAVIALPLDGDSTPDGRAWLRHVCAELKDELMMRPLTAVDEPVADLLDLLRHSA